MDTELALAYKNAPKKVRVGRVLMWIGCILFFVAAIFDLVGFIVAIAAPEMSEVDWGDPAQAIKYGTFPLLAVFFILAGIGGICFILDKGKFRSFATLAAVIMLVVILIDTVFLIRTLIYDWMGYGPGKAWANFFMGVFDVQVSGGIYCLGWFLCKDFVGD